MLRIMPMPIDLLIRPDLSITSVILRIIRKRNRIDITLSDDLATPTLYTTMASRRLEVVLDISSAGTLPPLLGTPSRPPKVALPVGSKDTITQRGTCEA